MQLISIISASAMMLAEGEMSGLEKVLYEIFSTLFGWVSLTVGIDDIVSIWNSTMDVVDVLIGVELIKFVGSHLGGLVEDLKPVAYALLLLFWMYGLFRTESTLVEMKRPEAVGKHLLRLGISIWLVENCKTFVSQIFTIGYSIYTTVNESMTSYSGAPRLGHISSGYFSAIVDTSAEAVATEDIGQIITDLVLNAGSGFGIGSLVVFYLVLSVINIGMRIAILYVFYDIVSSIISRIFRFLLLWVVSPIAMSTSASEDTQRVTFQFFKNLIAISAEMGITVVLIAIFPNVLSIILNNTTLLSSVRSVVVAVLFTGSSGPFQALTGVSVSHALSGGLLSDYYSSTITALLIFLLCIFTLKTSIKGMNNILDSLFGLHGV